uniref:Uncharacterized protein n=1 Tax=Anguilla anguilla TaxID=7936 RepID=A0A0E9P5B7_ANGAN
MNNMLMGEEHDARLYHFEGCLGNEIATACCMISLLMEAVTVNKITSKMS